MGWFELARSIVRTLSSCFKSEQIEGVVILGAIVLFIGILEGNITFGIPRLPKRSKRRRDEYEYDDDEDDYEYVRVRRRRR